MHAGIWLVKQALAKNATQWGRRLSALLQKQPVSKIWPSGAERLQVAVRPFGHDYSPPPAPQSFWKTWLYGTPAPIRHISRQELESVVRKLIDPKHVEQTRSERLTDMFPSLFRVDARKAFVVPGDYETLRQQKYLGYNPGTSYWRTTPFLKDLINREHPISNVFASTHPAVAGIFNARNRLLARIPARTQPTTVFSSPGFSLPGADYRRQAIKQHAEPMFADIVPTSKLPDFEAVLPDLKVPDIAAFYDIKNLGNTYQKKISPLKIKTPQGWRLLTGRRFIDAVRNDPRLSQTLAYHTPQVPLGPYTYGPD